MAVGIGVRHGGPHSSIFGFIGRSQATSTLLLLLCFPSALHHSLTRPSTSPHKSSKPSPSPNATVPGTCIRSQTSAILKYSAWEVLGCPAPPPSRVCRWRRCSRLGCAPGPTTFGSERQLPGPPKLAPRDKGEDTPDDHRSTGERTARSPCSKSTVGCTMRSCLSCGR